MNTTGVFSHKTDEWATPQDFFNKLDAEFHFTLDPCATIENAKCSLFYTKDQDGLTKTWGDKQCFVIRHIHKFGNGFKRAQKNQSWEQLLFCSFQLEQTRGGFMSMCSAAQK